jgi:DNA-binding response OmpR family regulator
LAATTYLTKPFSIEELLLKIEIFLRRRNISQPKKKDIYQLGLFKFDYPNLSLQEGEDQKSLTQKEADLLRFFAQNKNQVLKRPQILEELWGENDYFMGRSLDVFISRLRKYLSSDPELRIENIHGVGFRFRCPE